MLESRTFLISRDSAKLDGTQRCGIADPASGANLGYALEISEAIVRLVRLFLSESIAPKRIEVREQPDDSLLMVLTRGWTFLSAQYEIRDAAGELVGIVKRSSSRPASYAIFDAYDKQFADARGNFSQRDYQIRTPEQDYTLCRVRPVGDAVRLDISDDLDEQPPAKMRILAAVLILTMLVDSRTPNEDG